MKDKHCPITIAYDAIQRGPVGAVAGAGAGKTYLIKGVGTQLVLNHVCSADKILVLAYNHLGAKHLRDVFKREIGAVAAGMSIMTIHAFAWQMVRRYSCHLNLPSDVRIGDGERLLAKVTNEVFENIATRSPIPDARHVRTILSRAVNAMVSIQDVLTEPEYRRFRPLSEMFDDTLKRYQESKDGAGMVDFDDALVLLRRLLAKKDGPRLEIRREHRYLLVDEYQDCTQLQAKLIGRIAGKKQRVLITSDPAQCIYDFRGVRFETALDFCKTNPDVTIVQLNENHRSTPAIVAVAEAVTPKAVKRLRGPVRSMRDSGVKPTLVRAANHYDEGRWVARKICEHLETVNDKPSIGVLYRISKDNIYVADELAKHNVGFSVWGGFKFNRQRHVQDVIGLLQVIDGTRDPLAIETVMTQLPGVGPQTARKIAGHATTASLVDILPQFRDKGRGRQSISELMTLFDVARGTGQTTPAATVNSVAAYYRTLLKDKLSDAQLCDLDSMVKQASQHPTIRSYLEDTTLRPPHSTGPRGNLAPEEAPVVLSTIHSAKGHEWDVVFLINASSVRFPAGMVGSENNGRLVYTGVTRGRTTLYMSYAITQRGLSPHLSCLLGQRLVRQLRTQNVTQAENAINVKHVVDRQLPRRRT